MTSAENEGEDAPTEIEAAEVAASSSPTREETCWVTRGARFVNQHRSYYLSIVLAMMAALVGGFLLSRMWGSQQWGNVSEWVTGFLTLGAVGIALREGLRAQHARAVDHEVARRRECLKAVGDLWTGLAQMVFHFLSFTDYMENLPQQFDPNVVRQDNVPPDRPGEPIAYEIGARTLDFLTKWSELVEPPLFISLALVKNTPFDEPMKEINAGIRDILENELPKVVNIQAEAMRPDITELDRKWKLVLRNREEHLNLARKHFAVDLKTVESEMRSKK